MANHYASAIDVIAMEMSLEHMRQVCIDYAKRHPKAFVAAAAEAGNKRAIRATHPQTPGREINDECVR